MLLVTNYQLALFSELNIATYFWILQLQKPGNLGVAVDQHTLISH